MPLACVEPLVRHRHLVPTLALWFEQEWADYYGTHGPGNAEADLESACQLERLPVGLIALDSNQAPLGAVTLKERSISHHHLHPWVAGLMVAPPYRRQGVGAALVAACESMALELRYQRIYVATETAARIVERRNWRAFDTTRSSAGIVTLYVLDL